MSNFDFLKIAWPDLFESASKAEADIYPDSRAACFYARRTLELAVRWLYKHDGSLKLPYQDNLSAMIFEPTFRSAVGAAIHAKSRIVKDVGNRAVHTNKLIGPYDSLTAVRELFHVCFWVARTYGRNAKPADGLTFEASQLPKTSPVLPQTLAKLQQMSAELAEKDAKLQELATDKLTIDEELKRLRAEIAEIK